MPVFIPAIASAVILSGGQYLMPSFHNNNDTSQSDCVDSVSRASIQRLESERAQDKKDQSATVAELRTDIAKVSEKADKILILLASERNK